LLSAFIKANYDPNMLDHRRVITYDLAECDAAPRAFVAAEGKLFVACTSEGGGRGAIYELVDDGSAQPRGGDTVGSASLLHEAEDLNVNVLVVAAGRIYFVSDGEDAIYELPLAGGSPSRVAHARAVEYMVHEDGTLYVASDCGFQAIAL
jgi:hypothetical protein